MYLSSVHIKNFRGIREMDVTFDKQVTILLGENNGGKTSVIDALRLALTTQSGPDGVRLSEDDFYANKLECDIESAVEFDGLTDNEATAIHEALYAEETEQGCILKGKLTYKAHYNQNNNKIRSRIIGGQEDSGIIASNVFEYIDVTYLKPLRDPGTGLKPGRYSCVSKHARQVIIDESKKEIESDLNENRCKVIEHFSDLESMYNHTMQNMIGEIMSQNIKLSFMPATFDDLIASIKTILDDKEWELNGLGYNNIVYMSLVMAQHAQNKDAYNVILIEEPEAHIHPILLRSFLKYIKSLCENHNCQVIITTHSPILASKAKLESIRHISLNEDGRRIARQITMSDGGDEDIFSLNKFRRKKLERYLDATRGELFFSKKVMLVEGIAEQIMLPVIAEKLNLKLDEHNITIINCEGLNFDAFIPVLSSLNIQSVILTDTDKEKINDESNYLQKLTQAIGDHDYIRISKTPVTFEHALFQKEKIYKLSESAGKKLHRRAYANMQKAKSPSLSNNNISTNKPTTVPWTKDNLYNILFKQLSTSKGEFAQYLLSELEEARDTANQEIMWDECDFPDNIVQSLKWLCGHE